MARSSEKRGRPAKSPASSPRSAAPYRGFIDAARRLGAVDAKIIAPKDVETGAWVRLKCQYGCGGYGECLVCPPYTPTPAETRAVLDEYRVGILFEAPSEWGKAKEITAALEREVFLEGYYKAFGFGAGPCPLCNECKLDEGCRHAEKARPSMEACGIDVYATARKHGYTINVVRDESDAQHYFGLVLIE